MTTDETNFELQRQIDKIDGKVDKLDLKVETGFEGVNALVGAKLEGIEQRLDMTARQHQQAIELLISAQSSSETQVQMVDRDFRSLKAEHKALEDRVAAIADNLKWTVRSLIVTVAGAIASLVVALIK